ncbi:MAG: RpiB/LacA/LacB family sugar-phosphate isomerase, partial [Chloroflexi bacterium]|nr:RpiB/LacA/LacB family sugar-phosphate isomerase [Chloroflexota bacterium]
MKIALGADHGGFPLKQKIRTWLEDAGHHVDDVGALAFDAEDDYPDYAILVARSVGDQRSERGIIVCGSGVGAGVAANK